MDEMFWFALILGLLIVSGCNYQSKAEKENLEICQQDLIDHPINTFWAWDTTGNINMSLSKIGYVFYYQDHEGESTHLSCHQGTAVGENINYLYCTGKRTTNQIVADTGSIIRPPKDYNTFLILNRTGKFNAVKQSPTSKYPNYYIEFEVLNTSCIP